MAAMAALELEGQLQLVDPQQREISLIAEGDTLAIGFPDLRSARHAHAAFAAQGGGNRVMQTLQTELRRADLALDFRVRGVSVAFLAGHSRSNLTAKMLGLGSTRLRLGGLLRSLFTR